MTIEAVKYSPPTRHAFNVLASTITYLTDHPGAPMTDTDRAALAGALNVLAKLHREVTALTPEREQS